MQAVLVSQDEKGQLKSIKELNKMKSPFKKTRMMITPNQVGGIPVDSLPASEMSITAEKIRKSKPSSRILGRNKMLYTTLLNRLRNGDYAPNEQAVKVISDIKGNPVMLKDRRSTEKYRILKPLQPVLKLALESVGETPGKSLDVTAEKFYNKVVRPSKKTGVMNFQMDYPEINTSQMTIDSADNARDTIIDAILSFARTARDKQDAGQPLTGVEKILADGSRVVEKNLTEKAKEQAGQKLGESILFNRRTQLIILGAIVGIILITVAIAKK